MLNETRAASSKKAPSPIEEVLSFITADVNELHCAKAHAPIELSDSDAEKSIEVNSSQLENAPTPISETDVGIVIVLSFVEEKAPSSMVFNELGSMIDSILVPARA